jgi:hypothetical protein
MIKSRSSEDALGVGDSTFLGVSSSRIGATSEVSYSILCLAPADPVSMGTKGPSSTSAQIIVASAISLAGAGVDALVDSKTASSTLAILLLLGVIVGAFDAFGNSGSGSGLKIFGSPASSPNFGSSAAFPLASAGCFGASADSVAGTLGISADSSLEPIGAGRHGSEVEDVPSANFGTLAISMYLGLCVKTLIFYPSAQQR